MLGAGAVAAVCLASWQRGVQGERCCRPSSERAYVCGWVCVVRKGAGQGARGWGCGQRLWGPS